MLGVQFMVRLCLSLTHPLQHVFFFLSFAWWLLLLNWFSTPPKHPPSSQPEEIFLYVDVDSVCLWEEVCSGSSYVVILNQNSNFCCLMHSVWYSCNSRQNWVRQTFCVLCYSCFITLVHITSWGRPHPHRWVLQLLRDWHDFSLCEYFPLTISLINNRPRSHTLWRHCLSAIPFI